VNSRNGGQKNNLFLFLSYDVTLSRIRQR